MLNISGLWCLSHGEEGGFPRSRQPLCCVVENDAHGDARGGAAGKYGMKPGAVGRNPLCARDAALSLRYSGVAVERGAVHSSLLCMYFEGLGVECT